MYSFVNDYSEGAHPKVLEHLVKFNLEGNIGYGLDHHSVSAAQSIKRWIGREDLDIHFLPGGTITNLLVISAMLRPHHCVVAAETGHINVHETGAVEATGHKVVTMPGVDGKLTPEDIQKALLMHTDEHMVKPGMVYISDSTELGTIYSKAELSAISGICRANGLLLFLDGARLGAALTCRDNDLTLGDIAELVDVFYIGGTKNGALLGEALVICNGALKEDFRYLIKQRGAMLAKGFVVGLQFEALFEDRLFFELACHANRMAEMFAKAIEACGYSFYTPPCTNQLFPVLPNSVVEKLKDEFGFLDQVNLDNDHTAVRLVTSFATTAESVDSFKNYLEKLS